MYDFMDKVSKFKMPDKVNVLSPDGQDEVVDNYRNYCLLYTSRCV